MSTKKNKTQARGDPDLDSHLPESQFSHPSSGDNDSTYFLGLGEDSRRNARKNPSTLADSKCLVSVGSG